MNGQQPQKISIINPINPAIDRVKLILFEPFDLSKWFIIGFCAFLANLGQGGANSGYSGGRDGGSVGVRDGVDHGWTYFQNNIEWIIPLIFFVAVFGLVLWLVITWISSRGKFMFLHCVSENKAEVKVPWSKFGRHADRLFLFRIVLGAICFALGAIPVFMIVGFVITSIAVGAQNVTAVFGVVMIILFIFLVLIAYLLIRKFTMDFVVPIMFLRTTSCIAAWREFQTILSNNKGSFALYILLQIAITIGILAVVSVGFCIGMCCCCIGVFLLIPYISTVVLLPIHVFMRSYSLYFLQQFGPQFDAFRPDIITVQAEPSQNIQ